MRIGASRRAGAMPAGAAIAGAGRRNAGKASAGAVPAYARFAGEIAGKYGPIRPGVRSGQPLVFRVSSQEKKGTGKGRERAPFRPPERSSAAGPVTPAREKPEIRYRDIVRDRPGPAGKDRVIEREKVIERERLVEREKIVERVVERNTVVVREAERVVVEQRRIREAALTADAQGRLDEPSDSAGAGSTVRGVPKGKTNGSSDTAKTRTGEKRKTEGKGNKRNLVEAEANKKHLAEAEANKKHLAEAEGNANSKVEDLARAGELDIEDEEAKRDEGASPEASQAAAPKSEASRADKSALLKGTTFAETLTRRTSWPLSAKANAVFRRKPDGTSAGAKIPLSVKPPKVRSSRKKVVDQSPGENGTKRAKRSPAVYAQLLFVNPKLRVDGSRSVPDGTRQSAHAQTNGEQANRAARLDGNMSRTSEVNGPAPEQPQNGAGAFRNAEELRSRGTPSANARGSAEAHDNVQSESSASLDMERKKDRSDNPVLHRESLSDTPSSMKVEKRGDDSGDIDRRDGATAEASRDSGGKRRRSDKDDRELSRRGQASHTDDFSPGFGLTVRGKPLSVDDSASAEGTRGDASFHNRPVYRLSYALKPGVSRAEGVSGASGEKTEASESRREQANGLPSAQSAGPVAPQAATGGRWSLRRPDDASSMHLVYRNLIERGRQISVKRSIGLGTKTAEGQANAPGTAAVLGLINERMQPTETRLGLTAGSLKLSHRLIGRSISFNETVATSRKTNGSTADRKASGADRQEPIASRLGTSERNSGDSGQASTTHRSLQSTRETGQSGATDREPEGVSQSSTVHAKAREPEAVSRSGLKGAADGEPTSTIHAKVREKGNASRTDSSGREGVELAPTVQANVQEPGDVSSTGAKTSVESGVTQIVRAKLRATGNASPIGTRSARETGQKRIIYAKLRATGNVSQTGARSAGESGQTQTVRAKLRATGNVSQTGARSAGESGQTQTVRAKLRATGAVSPTDARSAGESGQTQTVRAKLRATGAVSPTGAKGVGGGEQGPTVEASKREAGASIRSRGLSDVPSAEAGRTRMGAQGRLAWLARRARLQDGGGLQRFGPIGSAGAIISQNRLDSPENRGNHTVPRSQAQLTNEENTPMLIKRTHSSESSSDEYASLGESAVRREGISAVVAHSFSGDASSQEKGGVTGGDQRSRRPLTQAIGRRSLVRVTPVAGRTARPILPGATAALSMRQSLRDTQLPPQASSDQSERVDTPRLSLAHASLSVNRAGRDTAVPGNAAEAPAHTHESDTPLELRRNAPAAAEGAKSTENAASEAPAVISEEALQKAISGLPQFHPDELADQVYKSLVRRMKLEQRLHGF
ncbi:hypothetical protein J4772_22240 [Cohnella sp. LGH]|uniref:hypothetical protein n=1 Tax=Cohnella sp. LGH TaxID=1619153 RepID=UPI001ADBE3AC|nr:hypothetical protein [Cohnella sp. LGH]QTH40305.1 hypothetical protein J4772_22240 [Cohnella sp. LGH]